MDRLPRLLFLITEDWYFWSHRLDLARLAARSGFDVSIATRVTDHGDRIRREGFALLPIRLLRKSRNLGAELASIVELISLYKRERPAIVHHVALKPMLYGSFAAWWAGVPCVVNAFAGLGYAFTERHGRGRILRNGLRLMLKGALSLSRSVVVFQNREDRDLMVNNGVVNRNRTRIIPGSGVDTKAFDLQAPGQGAAIVMLASRMLWDKGIGEFVEAARRLKDRGVSARYVLVGRCDEHNPAAIDPHQLRRWVQDGVVEWWGHHDDMPETLGAAAIVVLPSYREGLPKILLEASASGKAVIAADVPGIRQIVEHGVTGFLVPPRDPAALAAAIESLLGDPSLRVSMGLAGREAVIRNFSVEKAAGAMLNLYRELLDSQASAPPAAGAA
ncbi:glycosyl transferase family 1 [Nitrospira sp. KM1]|uniref:glycosyltransferase family 4 protein n=1 Tax=Nitrospira sp. KM1 TaxID=1936990 RepID=UPI0013A7635E|nr:glycosyltransferase family 4 protein [Nitrospira sp. KM1]BCA54204.1 glycosyl transferase family 1 [Nitrospira sp. KM1]